MLLFVTSKEESSKLNNSAAMAGKRKKDEAAGSDVSKKQLLSDAAPSIGDANLSRGMNFFASDCVTCFLCVTFMCVESRSALHQPR